VFPSKTIVETEMIMALPEQLHSLCAVADVCHLERMIYLESASGVLPTLHHHQISVRNPVTVALSVTIRPQFAIECLRRSN